MLDEAKRTTILTLAAKGQTIGAIAKALEVSRNTVKGVVRSGSTIPVVPERAVSCGPHTARIEELVARCKSNVVRVHEELAAEGIVVPYSTLTRFCRRQGMTTKTKPLVGAHEFGPGQEMQHDTSPHQLKTSGVLLTVQCASLTLCYSHMIFAQLFPVWNRFWCKVFLTDALVFFEGAAASCMLDNSTVIMVGGTGPDAFAAPEMEAFATRFGFTFVAHIVGDAKRSGRVERPFHFIENNFYSGRTFTDLRDANAQLRRWCDEKNGVVRSRLRASPLTLYESERGSLKPLPAYVPEVERIHTRMVDSEGYLNLHRNRYSVPAALLGIELTVHESKDRVRAFHHGKIVAEHTLLAEGAHGRVTLPAHRAGLSWRHRQVAPPMREHEALLRANSTVLAVWLDAANARGKLDARALRRAHRMWIELPIEALETAFATATAHGLFDLTRIETIALREVRTRFFRLPTDPDPTPGEGHDPSR